MTKPILIVVASFYRDIADALLSGATAALNKASHPYEVIEVPGALEIPASIGMAIASQHYSGFVALGCVIRGETSHYDIVCNESAKGLQKLALNHHVAIGNGILTVETRSQALERALPDRKDKGADAVEACLAMISLQQKFGITQ